MSAPRLAALALLALALGGCAASPAPSVMPDDLEDFAVRYTAAWCSQQPDRVASYRTTDDRGLTGQSLGGLFAAFALFEAPGLFQRVGIHSPSLWWGEGEAFAMEAGFAEAHTALPAHVLLSVGSEEGPSMLPPIERLGDVLQGRGYGGLTVDAVVFADETHTSVVPAQVSRTLRTLYGRSP